MIRPLDRHLDGDELDALVESQAPGVSVAGRLSAEAVQEAQRHVESCQDCDRKVQMHRSVQSAIRLRAISGQAGKGPNCSEETEWVRVAAGLLEESEAKERMNHAAQCGHCGPLLKAAARTLSDETTPDEEAALAKLTSVRPDWQARMARTLRSAADPRQPQRSALSSWTNLFHWPRPAFAAVALAILVAGSWIGVRVFARRLRSNCLRKRTLSAEQSKRGFQSRRCSPCVWNAAVLARLLRSQSLFLRPRPSSVKNSAKLPTILNGSRPRHAPSCLTEITMRPSRPCSVHWNRVLIPPNCSGILELHTLCVAKGRIDPLITVIRLNRWEKHWRRTLTIQLRSSIGLSLATRCSCLPKPSTTGSTISGSIRAEIGRRRQGGS